jgi:hypothetical protein
MKAAIGTATGSRSGSGTVGSNAETASYASAPTAPPVNRGIPSIGRTRRRGTKARSPPAVRNLGDVDRQVRRVDRARSPARLGPGNAITDLEQPARADAEERIASDAPPPSTDLRRYDGPPSSSRRNAPIGVLRSATRRAQQDRVGVAGQTLRLGQAERIRRRHRVGL